MRARHVIVAFCLFALAVPALAQSRGDRRGGGGLDRVLPQIRHSVPGTFYDAEGPFFSPDGQAVYRIKWMTPEGRMIWFSVDARSGRIVGGAAPAPRRDEARPHFQDGGRDGSRNDWRDNRPGDRNGAWDRDEGHSREQHQDRGRDPSGDNRERYDGGHYDRGHYDRGRSEPRRGPSPR